MTLSNLSNFSRPLDRRKETSSKPEAVGENSEDSWLPAWGGVLLGSPSQGRAFQQEGSEAMASTRIIGMLLTCVFVARFKSRS